MSVEDKGHADRVTTTKLKAMKGRGEVPERAGEDAWPEALHLSLEFAEAGARRLTAKVPQSWQHRWPPR